jgi:hypothetical protein
MSSGLLAKLNLTPPKSMPPAPAAAPAKPSEASQAEFNMEVN